MSGALEGAILWIAGHPGWVGFFMGLPVWVLFVAGAVSLVRMLRNGGKPTGGNVS